MCNCGKPWMGICPPPPCPMHSCCCHRPVCPCCRRPWGHWYYGAPIVTCGGVVNTATTGTWTVSSAPEWDCGIDCEWRKPDENEGTETAPPG
jgi:hypothetical protein